MRREMAEAQGTYEIYSASLSRLLQQRWPLSIGPEELAQEAASKGHPMEAVVIPWLQKELEALRGGHQEASGALPARAAAGSRGGSDRAGSGCRSLRPSAADS
jgi:hypothetical protein